MFASWSKNWRGDDEERAESERKLKVLAPICALTYAFGYTLFAYDQVMSLGWKFMIEVATVYVVIMAVAIHLVERVMGVSDLVMRGAIYTVLNVVLAYIVFVVLDRGLIIKGSAHRPVQATEEG